jgi:hypothetical protein
MAVAFPRSTARRAQVIIDSPRPTMSSEISDDSPRWSKIFNAADAAGKAALHRRTKRKKSRRKHYKPNIKSVHRYRK